MMDRDSTPNFDVVNPALCLNAKLRKLHRILNNAYQKKINAFGLRGSMLSILFIVGKKEKINQRTLADMLVLDESTMSRDIQALMSKGWISRRRSSEDRRKYDLEVTEEGFKLLERVSPIWLKLHQSVETILGQHQIAQIDVITAAIQQNMVDIET